MRSNSTVGTVGSSLWVAWNPHRRTAGLCAAWDIPLHVLQPALPGPARWAALPLQTLRLLRRFRPGLLFVQNPSLALTTLAVFCRPVFGYRLVVDAHNEGVRPYDRPYAFVRWLTRHLLKSADVTIVTNDALADDVLAAGGRPVILPDSLPAVPDSALTGLHTGDGPDVAVIATFRRDEPIDAIIAAAALLPDVRFAFSGPAERYRGASDITPPNVRLTGFLDDFAYWQLLAQAKVVCDLTLKPDCLVCGAYEALALGKPMVLSDDLATREVFGPAAVLTTSSPEAIAAAVKRAIAERERLRANARELRETFRTRWQDQAIAVWDSIEAQTGAGARAAA
jgi:glycosyltransferase involved in cell wall biosynthesis